MSEALTMSLLGGMKDRLGFGGKPEWADDEDGYYEDDAIYDEEYDDYGDLDPRREGVQAAIAAARSSRSIPTIPAISST